ncbi:MAG: DUF3566 domain-containing protein [Actinomycetales bacterium]
MTAARGATAATTVTPTKKQAVRQAAATPPVTPAAKVAAGAPRRVRLVVSRIDPWSMMKMSFLLSVALGIALVIALAVAWTVLDGMGVFSQVNEIAWEVRGNEQFNILEYVGLSRVLSLGTVLAVVNVALLTALGTLLAVLYNISSALVGGITTTLTDD